MSTMCICCSDSRRHTFVYLVAGGSVCRLHNLLTLAVMLNSRIPSLNCTTPVDLVKVLFSSSMSGGSASVLLVQVACSMACCDLPVVTPQNSKGMTTCYNTTTCRGSNWRCTLALYILVWRVIARDIAKALRYCIHYLPGARLLACETYRRLAATRHQTKRFVA